MKVKKSRKIEFDRLPSDSDIESLRKAIITLLEMRPDFQQISFGSYGILSFTKGLPTDLLVIYEKTILDCPEIDDTDLIDIVRIINGWKREIKTSGVILISDYEFMQMSTLLDLIKYLEEKNLSFETFLSISNYEPTCIPYYNKWIFKGYEYIVPSIITEEQAILLILDDYDKERLLFERLKHKYRNNDLAGNRRIRIPEYVRIEVWQRDDGKCARCGNRENLEYDHIVPISKGGGNTARNIELLCEKCNRLKRDNIG